MNQGEVAFVTDNFKNCVLENELSGFKISILSGAEIDMSICLMVSNPINENEKCIYVPVSTERVFENYWLLAIEKLDLKWVRCFQCGIEIGKDELEPVKMELTELKTGLLNI